MLGAAAVGGACRSGWHAPEWRRGAARAGHPQRFVRGGGRREPGGRASPASHSQRGRPAIPTRPSRPTCCVRSAATASSPRARCASVSGASRVSPTWTSPSTPSGRRSRACAPCTRVRGRFRSRLAVGLGARGRRRCRPGRERRGRRAGRGQLGAISPSGCRGHCEGRTFQSLRLPPYYGVRLPGSVANCAGGARATLIPGTPREWAQVQGVPVEKLGRLFAIEDALRACLAQWP